MTARFDFSGKKENRAVSRFRKVQFRGYFLEDFARDLTHEHKN